MQLMYVFVVHVLLTFSLAATCRGLEPLVENQCVRCCPVNDKKANTHTAAVKSKLVKTKKV